VEVQRSKTSSGSRDHLEVQEQVGSSGSAGSSGVNGTSGSSGSDQEVLEHLGQAEHQDQWNIRIAEVQDLPDLAEVQDQVEHQGQWALDRR
jgi:hypothetical protein